METIGAIIAGIVGLAVLIIWLWALIDILKSDFKDSINKIIWLLVVFFLSFMGVILYYFIGRKQKR